MARIFPNFPTSGKNSAVFVSTSDGPLLTLEEMELQASYPVRGEAMVNRVYLLGTGRTLINVRPAEQPDIIIDGVLQGFDAVPGTLADTIDVEAGLIEVDGVETPVDADTVTVDRPAPEKWAWNLVSVNKSTGVLTVTKGTDTATDDVTELLNTYGANAGQKPLIPVADLLLLAIRVYSNASAAIAPVHIRQDDREFGAVDYELLPNVGGVLIQSALVPCHVGSEARDVKFTGRFLDNVLARIGTAKSFSITSQTSETTNQTFTTGYAETEISSWGLSFEQLATDEKILDAAFDRQGHCAVRLLLPNGRGVQGVATVAPTINSQVGSMVNISVSGSFGDRPEKYTG